MYGFYQPRKQMFYLYTLHNVLLHKTIKTIWMFYGQFAEEGDNPLNNQPYII